MTHNDSHQQLNTSIHDELLDFTDGMEEWLERRQQRRSNGLRLVTLVIAVAVSVGSAAMLLPERSDTYVSGDLSCCVDKACSYVDEMLANS